MKKNAGTRAVRFFRKLSSLGPRNQRKGGREAAGGPDGKKNARGRSMGGKKSETKKKITYAA